MQPKFLYFDLGKVLVNFSVDQMLRQMGAVAGVAAEEVRAALFGNGLMREHESGRLSERQFYGPSAPPRANGPTTRHWSGPPPKSSS